MRGFSSVADRNDDVDLVRDALSKAAAIAAVDSWLEKLQSV